MDEEIIKTLRNNLNTIQEAQQVMKKSMIGLLKITLAHIDNGDIDKARETVLGTIVNLEGVGEEWKMKMK